MAEFSRRQGWNREQRERLDRINQSILRCRSEMRQLSERNTEVLVRFSSLSKKRLILSKKMATLSGQIESRRVRNLKELLVILFPVDLAVSRTAFLSSSLGEHLNWIGNLVHQSR
ncbi:unnamed protein product [Echinostoma caproni]|uniref:Uncharacterized protein n=1 Tax=Echinostoma caproni TaxID=27848 RepID=A0A183BB17_9TREM|nr:unnamed protein product [Echinostoma caproni]